MKESHFLLGVTLGALAGAAAALLLTPKTGAEMREFLGEKLDEKEKKYGAERSAKTAEKTAAQEPEQEVESSNPESDGTDKQN